MRTYLARVSLVCFLHPKHSSFYNSCAKVSLTTFKNVLDVELARPRSSARLEYWTLKACFLQRRKFPWKSKKLDLYQDSIGEIQVSRVQIPSGPFTMIKVKKTKIADKVDLLDFKNQHDISSTFIRFQEYYESPKFKGKIFALKEYKKWYKSINGRFTYYQDWHGFNIPSYVLVPFYKGKFNPLSKKEKVLLNLFREEKHPFYIIGVHSGDKDREDTLKHEIAHSLFYTNPKYKKDVKKILNEYNLDELEKQLLLTGGYNKSTIKDELHTYSMERQNKYDHLIPTTLYKRLNKLFNKYYSS